MTPEDIIADIKKYGKSSVGRKEFIKHLEGKRITPKQRIQAYCYTCMAYFVDGKHDCEQTTCPLHPYMPQRGVKCSPEAYDSDSSGE